ncbi:MAG: pentapeptide repeat-containing protein [Bacteroidota bacterium]
MQDQYHNNKVFEDVVFPGGNAVKREFEKCTFKNCNLTGCDFSNSIFIDCTFFGCNLASLKLKGASIQNITFKNCKVIGVNFSECKEFMFSVSFENSVLNYAVFSGRKMAKTKFLKTSLKDVDFSGTELMSAVFKECDMLGAVFNRTFLQKADFTEAYNYAIDPELNTIKGAKFALDGLPGLLMKYDIDVM